MAILDDFKARFPEFDSAVVDQYIPILEPVYPCYYGGDYVDCGVEIILNLLAHMLVIETASGYGSVQSEQSKSVGSVSVSYAVAQPASQRDAWFMGTKYGARYLQLTRANMGAFFV